MVLTRGRLWLQVPPSSAIRSKSVRALMGAPQSWCRVVGSLVMSQVQIRVASLNAMAALGMPVSEPWG